jgi:ADP-ribose pyrophosphatase
MIMTESLPLFFFGSLRDTDLFALVAGRPFADFAIRPAAMAGHRARRADGEAYPVLTAEQGHRAGGLLVDLPDPTAIARIAFYETTDYRLAETEVLTAAGPVRAQFFESTGLLAATEETWSLERWQATAKPFALAAAELVMDHFGRVPHEASADLWPDVYARAAARLGANRRTG